ncbi:MAG: DUF2666 family protein [Candidatus Micrarchaeota archaeon]
MDGQDEIIFTGAYKDFRLGIRFDLSGKTPADAAGALGYVSEMIEPYAFKFSGIDMAAIEKLAEPKGNGPGAVAAFFDGIAPGELRAKLLATLPKPGLIPAAESYLLNRLLAKAGVQFKTPPSESLKPVEEETGDFIGFIGKYGQWVAIKKLGLEKVQDYEVSGILSGINHTIVNKAFDFAGAKTGADGGAEGGKRKSFGNLAEAMRGMDAGTGAFSLCRRLEKIGYKPYASPEMLTEAYPDIKPPKVRGRKPKG